MPRRRVVLVATVVALLVVAAGAVVVVQRLHRSPLEQALRLLPASSLRVSFTDWAAVRERLHPKVGSAAGVEAFMSRAYDADLSAASSVDEFAPALARHYGFSPANAEWEAFAQSRQGAVMVMRLPSSTDMDRIEDRLDSLGYSRPSRDLGVWRGGADLVAALNPPVSPELQYVVVDADRHLVLTSDDAGYAATAAKVVGGDADSLSGTDLPDLAGKAPEPAAAFLWRGGFACEDLRMGQADPADQATAKRLVRQAGGVDPLDGLLLAIRPDRTLDAVLGFEDDDQAADDLRPRARLFVGPAVGRSGSLADDVRLTRTRTDGSAVVLTGRPRQRSGFVLSLMNQGPVLFATC